MVATAREGDFVLTARSVSAGDRAMVFASPGTSLDAGVWLRFYATLPAAAPALSTESLRLARLSNPDYSQGSAVELTANGSGQWFAGIEHRTQRAVGLIEVPPSSWTCFEFYAQAGTPGLLELYVDGALAARRDDLDTVLPEGYRKLGVGLTTRMSELEASFDAVVLSPERPGCLPAM